MSLDMSMVIDRLRMDKKNPLKAALMRLLQGDSFSNLQMFYHIQPHALLHDQDTVQVNQTHLISPHNRLIPMTSDHILTMLLLIDAVILFLSIRLFLDSCSLTVLKSQKLN